MYVWICDYRSYFSCLQFGITNTWSWSHPTFLNPGELSWGMDIVHVDQDTLQMTVSDGLFKYLSLRHMIVLVQGCLCMYVCMYRIADNFRGRKLLRILHFWSYLRKFFLRNLGGGHQVFKLTCWISIELVKSLSCLCSSTSSLVIRHYHRLMVHFHKLYLRLVLQPRTRRWNMSSIHPTSQRRNESMESMSTSLPRIRR